MIQAFATKFEPNFENMIFFQGGNLEKSGATLKKYFSGCRSKGGLLPSATQDYKE